MRGVTVVQMPLLDGGAGGTRPVSCLSLGDGLFVVDRQPLPEGERWMFLPGQVVRCELREVSDGTMQLEAIAAVPEERATVREWLELHDSVLRAPDRSGDGAEVQVEGYVHRWETRAGVRFGLGLIRPVVFRSSRVDRVVASPTEDVEIADGSLTYSGRVLQNLIPLPFDAPGDALLSLLLCDGTTFEAAVTGCSLSASADGRFVEILPEDLDPTLA